MTIEKNNQENIAELTQLYLELFPECDFNEEFENFKKVMTSDSEASFLVKMTDIYAAFLHASIRQDYVEGSESAPVAYIEAVYVREQYRLLGLAKSLFKAAETWALEKGIQEIASDCALDNTASINCHLAAGFKEANKIICFIKKIQA